MVEMFLRKIPEDMRPWECNVNGVKYVYPAGTEQNVPAEVAALIDAYWEKQEVDYPETGISFNDLRDRPFGESTEVVLEETYEHGSTPAKKLNGYAEVNVGDVVKATYDGVEYWLEAYEDAKGCAIGNKAIAQGGEDTGEPFAMYFINKSSVCQIKVNSEGLKKTHTIKIEKSVIHTIDPKFLPGGGGGKVILYTDWPYLNKSADLGESTRPSKAEVFEYAKNGGFVVAEPDGGAYYFPLYVCIGGENGERAVVAFYDGGEFELYSKEYVPEVGE